MEPATPAPRGLRSLSSTQILIATNFLIFLAMLCHSIWLSGVEQFLNTRIGANFDHKLLLLWGSDYGPLTLGGQYWRVLTNSFVHLNGFHLGGGMLFLWRLGKTLDRLLGNTTTLVIYLLAGVASSLASLAWHPTVLSAGSSGAIYGEAGVLIALLALARPNLSRRQTFWILFWIVLMMPFGVLFGQFSETTDYSAHVGGLVCGLAIGVLLAWILRGSPLERLTRERQGLAFVAFILLLAFGGVIAMRHDVATQYRPERPSRASSTRTISSGTGTVPKLSTDESWRPEWDTDADKNRKVKPVLSPTVSFADEGFRGSPMPQSAIEREQERKNREIFVNSFQSEPQCHGITLKHKKPGEADFGLQVFNGIDGRTGYWQYVLYRMDTLGVREWGETTIGPNWVAQSVCSGIRGTLDRGGSVE
jgi:membrane associated rhomboid family serine protease